MNHFFSRLLSSKAFPLLFIVAVSGMAYLVTLRGIVGNPTVSDLTSELQQATMPFELSPERGRFTHLIALGEDHSYALSPELAAAAYPDVGEYQGKYYSFFAPGLAFMTFPAYELGVQFNLSQVFSFAFIALVSILGLIFLYKISREIFKLPVWAALMVVLTFAFGSTAWSYAITLYQHHVTTFFMLSSFYAVWRFKQHENGSVWWAVFVCVNYALSVTIDYPNAVLLLPIMVYLLVSSTHVHTAISSIRLNIRAELIVALLFLALVGGLHGYINQRYFGAWYHLSGGLADYVPPSEYQKKASDQQAAFTAEVHQKSITGFFKEERLPNGFYTLLFSTDRGLLFYSPIFVLSLLGVVWVIRKRKSVEMFFVLACIATNVFLYSSWGDPWGGWAYGPRYLIPSMALLSLIIGIFIVNQKQQILARTIMFILFAYSSAIALLGALTTNAVPPRIEAVKLENIYNFLLNLRFFQRGQSGSFMYHTFFAEHVALSTFYVYIYLALLAIFFSVVFIFSRYSHEY